MSKKSYLLAPTRDCPPSGPIALGNIIASPFSPEIALNTTPSRPFPPTVVVNRRVETDWVTSLNTSKRGKVGVYMQFCQMLGIGGNINIGARQTTSNTFAFEELQTISIFPDAAYIETRLQSPGVKEFVREHKFKKNVYMIIGVKIAKKGRIRTAIQKERSLYLQIGIDGTVAQLPFDAGPTIDISRATEESTSSNISEDFVLAFRLREIYYDKKKKNASQREYDKGALFGIDDDEGMEFESLGLAEDDVEADDLDINGQPGVDDDGEECECGILQEVDT